MGERMGKTVGQRFEKSHFSDCTPCASTVIICLATTSNTSLALCAFSFSLVLVLFCFSLYVQVLSVSKIHNAFECFSVGVTCADYSTVCFACCQCI